MFAFKFWLGCLRKLIASSNYDPLYLWCWSIVDLVIRLWRRRQDLLMGPTLTRCTWIGGRSGHPWQPDVKRRGFIWLCLFTRIVYTGNLFVGIHLYLYDLVTLDRPYTRWMTCTKLWLVAVSRGNDIPLEKTLTGGLVDPADRPTAGFPPGGFCRDLVVRENHDNLLTKSCVVGFWAVHHSLWR